jgi:chromosome segregation ATPase
MEITLDTILGILGLFIGGGGGAFFTWRWQRKKAKAEAKTAEADAAKELQDVYQQLVQDIKTDRDEQKAYIQELKEDRSHLRRDRDDLRKRQDELEEQVRGLQREVARNGRMVANMRPFLCGLLACKNRTPVTISEDAEIETQTS